MGIVLEWHKFPPWNAQKAPAPGLAQQRATHPQKMILLSIILQILSPRENHALRLHDRDGNAALLSAPAPQNSAIRIAS